MGLIRKISTLKLLNLSHLILFIACVGVLLSCAIPNSNALKNISIYTGILVCLLLIIENPSLFFQKKILPNWLLAINIVWVFFLSLYASEDLNLQMRELKSTWINTLEFMILGTIFGLVCQKDNYMKRLFVLSFFLLPIIYAGNFIFEILYYSRHLADPFYSLFHTKAHATYFLMWPFLFACALFLSSIDKTENNSAPINKFLIYASLIFLIFICYLLFFLLHSLNGILISTLFLILCSIFLLKKLFYFFNKNKTYLLGTILSILLITPYILGEIQSNKKFSNMLNDAIIGWQIHKYTEWKMDSGCIWECSPKLTDGYSPNASTYYRVASFHKGLLLLAEHPLGSGITHLSYGYYMLKEYPKSIADHTHSGWIDFALGVGIPGLLLVWLSILITILRNIKVSNDNKFVCQSLFCTPRLAIISLSGISILWLILETGEKEYIKHLFFMISFFSAVTPFNHSNN